MSAIMKRILLLAVFFFPLIACANNLEWKGAYIYEADFGKNAAEQSVLVEYFLEIGDDSCKLSIQGYQVSEIILCRAEGHSHALGVKFQSYEDGSLKNQYGIQIYTVDQVLFHLNSKKELITHWDALLPDGSVVKPGKYFLKTAK